MKACVVVNIIIEFEPKIYWEYNFWKADGKKWNIKQT
jgi:hypothetical protein